jgi:putative flippase GtrA
MAEKCSQGTGPGAISAFGSNLSGMKSSLLKLWRLSRSPEGLKVIRYTLVSVISAITSLVVLIIVFGVLRLWSEVYSTLFSNILAGIPSYILNRRWVWKKSGRSHVWREIVPFWAMSLIGIVFALFVAGWAHNYGRAHHLHHFDRTLLVVAANVAAFGVLWLLKLALFNRIFAQIADIEVGAEDLGWREVQPPG